MKSCKSCGPVSKTSHCSWKAGKLAKGCELCVKGEKLVLFITGLCSQRCFYCPVSEQKFGSDVVFADEWQVKNPNNPVELIEEAKLIRAKGAGITGGDPLASVDRCCEYIRLLKQNFGKDFHVHLYTPLILVTQEKLAKLFDAGLDEIRFHPNLDDKTLWPRLDLAKKFSWSVGVEIPVIPGYDEKTKALIDFIADKVDFINLNELEMSDTQAHHYNLPKNFIAKDSLSYGVKGSEKLALELVKYSASKGLCAHFCTARLKDKVQVGQRLKRRAETTAKIDEQITKEGTIIRGIIYLKDTIPGINYRKHLQEINKEKMIEKLIETRNKLIAQNIFSSYEICVDEQKFRLVVSAKRLKKSATVIKNLNLCPAIVEEYPTADALEIDVQFI